MNKTLHKTSNKKSLKFYTAQLRDFNGHEQLTDLLDSMGAYLNEAAKDTLHPRPQAILQLLRKAGV